MDIKSFWELLRETFSEWSEDRASRLAAALAYYATFSLAPLLIIAIAMAGLIFGQEAVQSQIIEQVQGLIGDRGARLVQTMIEGAYQPTSRIPATVIGIATLLFGASGVFAQLHSALNTIWNVAPRPGRGVLALVKDRFISFTMVLAVGFLLLVSLVVSAALAALGRYLDTLLPNLINTVKILNLVISFGVVTLLFAMIYKFLPDVKIKWGDVWIGAAITSLLFTVGKQLIGLYLGHSSAASVYGAAGSLAIILIWIYYSAQIVFLGAEFTQVYARKYGSRIKPAEHAVRITVEEPDKQERVPQIEDGAPTDEGLERVTESPPPGDQIKYRTIPDKQLTRLKRQRCAAALLGLAAGLIFATQVKFRSE